MLADVIHGAMDTAMDVKRRAKGGAWQNIVDQFENLRLIAGFAVPDAKINVLRQGFILLMTAFDAAIFDLVRVKLRKDFFALIGVFGKLRAGRRRSLYRRSGRQGAPRGSATGSSRSS